MKKLLSTVLAFAMIGVLAASCQGAAATAKPAGSAAATTAPAGAASEKAEATTAPAGTGEAKKWKIAVVPKMTTIAWFQRMEQGIKMYNEQFKDDVFYGGSTDGAGQAAYVESLLAEKYDAICVTPFDTEAMEPVLEKARKAGTIVVTHEASSMKNIDYDVEAFDNVKIGEVMMKNIGEKIGGKGEYIQLVGALTSKTHMEWTGGAEGYQKANFPDMKMVGKFETKDSQDEAYNKVKEALTANPNIVAIQTSASTDMAGASRAVEELGLKGKITIVGFSLWSVSGKYVEDGIATGYYFWDSAMAGMAQIEIAKAVLENRIDDVIKNGVKDPFIKGYDKMELKDKTFYANSYVYIDKTNVGDEAFHY